MRTLKNSMLKAGIVAAALLALQVTTSSVPIVHAEDEFELGGFLGLHIFSEDNEIGVADEDDANSPANSFVLGARLGYAITPMFVVEGEVGFLPAKAREGDTELLGLVYRVNALAQFGVADTKFRPFALIGAGGMHLQPENAAFDEDDDFAFHFGGGFKYQVGEAWGFRTDLRILLPPSSASESVTTDVEILVGLFRSFPHTFKPKEVLPPPPPPDPDNDGIVGDADKCPNDPEDKDGFEDEDGCPDNDNDADGIADADDKCPNEPEAVNGFEDEDGCPEQDADSDGLFDSQDKCPNEPEDKDGFEDEDGCPDDDNDGDGIPDSTDQCVNEAETANGFEDADGCPDTVPEQVAKFTGTIEGIRFRTGSAVIVGAGSYRILNEAAKVLKEFPELKLEISGHTDDVGADDKNKTLSQNRAESVKAYLVKKGIAEERLTAIGFGEEKPVADNKTPAGRAQNRRVEFKLVN